MPPADPPPPPGEPPLATRSLEEITFERLQAFLSRLQGQRVPGLYRMIMEQVERALLRAALEETGGHLGEAARLLDLDRNTLARKIQGLGLPKAGTPGKRRPRGAS